MSSIAPQPETPMPEDLVAYLDGELTPDECRRVEQRLASDEGYRQQLRDLDRAWEALDSLPAAKATDDFARTTMELVTVAAEGEASKVTATTESTRRNHLMWQLAAGAAVAALSFVIARAILPDPNRQLLNDLPVIRQAEALQLVPSVEFLRQLGNKVPVESLRTDDEAATRELTHIELISSDSPAVRREWIESQSSEQKARLAAAAERFFEARNERERSRLIDLQRAISVATDSKRLQATLVAYGQWLAGLSAARQETLREEMAEASTDEQVAIVHEFVQSENAKASRQLSDEDANRLRRELFAIATERRAELAREVGRHGERDHVRRLEGPAGTLMIVARELGRDGSNERVRNRLIETLSPNAREHLDGLSRRDRRTQLFQWALQAMQTNVGPDDLERFFAEKLDNDMRQRLLNMPASEMQKRLERLYFATDMGSGEAAPWWDELPSDAEMRGAAPGEHERRFSREGARDDRPPGPTTPDFMDRDRIPPGPGGPRGPAGPRDGGQRDGRPPRFDRPGGPPPDGPPPGGPPLEDI